MIEKIDVFKIGPYPANIKQTSIKRDWMDNTYESHAYRCFPVSIANTLGYEISFPEDISFIWDGISDSTGDHVRILSGEKYAYSGRSNATISFYTGLIFKTSKNITMMHMPVPNFFVDGAQAFTSLISTSFYEDPIPSAWKITKPNEIITIKANQPVATILPIPLKEIASLEMNVYRGSFSKDHDEMKQEYGEAAQAINKVGGWTDWYRNATNHKNESIGAHEVKSIKLKINDYTNEERKIIS
jgi:hypothetical protein